MKTFPERKHFHGKNSCSGKNQFPLLSSYNFVGAKTSKIENKYGYFKSKDSSTVTSSKERSRKK